MLLKKYLWFDIQYCIQNLLIASFFKLLSSMFVFENFEFRSVNAKHGFRTEKNKFY